MYFYLITKIMALTHFDGMYGLSLFNATCCQNDIIRFCENSLNVKKMQKSHLNIRN